MIFPLTGDVRHSLTIDPTVWIFDERKRNIEELNRPSEDESDQYYAKMGKAWDEGLMQGARIDHNRPMSRTDKDAALRDSFAMPLAPFVANAEPLDHATHVVFYGVETLQLPLEELDHIFLQFSHNGKVLSDGPVYVLYAGETLRQVNRIEIQTIK